MKKLLSISLVLVLVIFAFASCKEQPTGLWKDATYTENASVGEGGTTFTLKITAEEKTVVLTVSTDKATLGDSLTQLELLDGEMGDFGLYVKQVNGMTLDYDTHGMYWALYVGGEYALTGADGVTVTNGAEYEFKAEK